MQQQIKRKTQKDSLVKEDWSISGETTTRALRKSNPTPTKPIQYLGVLWGELDGGGASRSAAQPGQIFLKSAHNEESNQAINKSNHHAAINTHPGILQSPAIGTLLHISKPKLGITVFNLSVGHSG